MTPDIGRDRAQDQSQYTTIFGLDRHGFLHLTPDGAYREIQGEGTQVLEYILARDLLPMLIENGLVRTEIITMNPAPILRHERIAFVTAPGEWSPAMLKDVALFLCRFNEVLSHNGLTLKDAHSLNVTFDRGKPIFLDFGSITLLGEPGKQVGPVEPSKKIRDLTLQAAATLGRRLPAGARRYLRQHLPETLLSDLRVLGSREQPPAWMEEFRACVLVPLWLGSEGDRELMRQFLRTEPRGLGHRLATTRWRQLPPWFRSYQKRNGLPRRAWAETLHALEKKVAGVATPLGDSVWATYRERYPEERAAKYSVVLNAVERGKPSSVVDLACNIGELSRQIANRLDVPVCAIDIDMDCIEHLYLQIRHTGERIQPAVSDLVFPNPPNSCGSLRPGSVDRFRAEMGLCLALVHHLVISGGLSMEAFAAVVSQYSTESLVVEFVEPSDKHLQTWQQNGVSIPYDYTLDHFMKSFSRYFSSYERLADYHTTRSSYLFSGRISADKPVFCSRAL